MRQLSSPMLLRACLCMCAPSEGEDEKNEKQGDTDGMHWDADADGDGDGDGMDNEEIEPVLIEDENQPTEIFFLKADSTEDYLSIVETK